MRCKCHVWGAFSLDGSEWKGSGNPRVQRAESVEFSEW